MSFSEESIEKLADVTATRVFDVIVEDGRFDEAVMNAMPGAIRKVMGDVSPQLTGALGYEIMTRIGIMVEPPEFNLWKTRYEALYRYVKKNYAESYVDGMEYDIPRDDYSDN